MTHMHVHMHMSDRVTTSTRAGSWAAKKKKKKKKKNPNFTHNDEGFLLFRPPRLICHKKGALRDFVSTLKK